MIARGGADPDTESAERRELVVDFGGHRVGVCLVIDGREIHGGDVMLGVVVDDPLQGPGEGRAVADLPVAAFEAADDGKLVIESDYGD